MVADTIPIKGFLETSFVDWPGKVASVVFLPGCNYRCPYCHNHRLVTEPAVFSTWPLQEVLEKLEPLRSWVDGVCVTGGEPTIHSRLPELLERFAEAGWPVKLDTNGSNPELVAELLEKKLVNAVSLDVKAPFEPIPYRRNGGQGADPEPVARTLGLVAKSGLPLELRTTVHPKLLGLDELKRMALQIVELAGQGHEVKLQACRTSQTLDPTLADEEQPDQGLIDSWAAEINQLTRREAC